ARLVRVFRSSGDGTSPVTFATLFDAASGILLAGAATWAAYAIASTLKARASSVRLTAAAVILLWLLTVAFLVLSPLHLFVRVVVVLLALAGAALAQILTRRADPSARAREDLRALRTWWSTLG